jgi:hypothetical protein
MYAYLPVWKVPFGFLLVAGDAGGGYDRAGHSVDSQPTDRTDVPL